jgi:nucleoside-diphosphate-sugar epimerase
MGKLLLLGASSQIGCFILPRLRAAGYEVMAISRGERPDGDGIAWYRGQVPDGMPQLPPLDAIVSFGPVDHLALWLSGTILEGAPQIIATSSMSAESKRESMLPAERAISQRLRDAESSLADTCTRQGLALTLFRPTLVYGAGMDKSLTPIARRAIRQRVFPLPAGRGLRQPVHADDIARAAMAALGNAGAAGRIFPLGGGERLSAADMFARVRRSLPVATLPLPLPRWLLQTVGKAVAPVRGAINRLDDDLIADNGDLERVLGIHPRPFAVDAACWRVDAG